MKISSHLFILFFYFIIEFWEIIQLLESEGETFSYLCKNGLKSNVNKESLIALFSNNERSKGVTFYEFPKIKNSEMKIGALTKYDIPQYIQNIPNGFSCICTIGEANKIKIALGKKRNQTIDKYFDKKKEKCDKKEIESDQDCLIEPLPNNKHKYCHLCKIKYNNYIEHIYCYDHLVNRELCPSFNGIRSTFTRICNFWKNKQNESNTISNNICKYHQSNAQEKNKISQGNFEDYNSLLKISSQLNKSFKKGCEAKRKIINNSTLSTSQSFPIIPPVKKRKKKDFILDKNTKITISIKDLKKLMEGNLRK